MSVLPMVWVQEHPQAHEGMLGYIPQFLSNGNPKTAKEQFNQNYRFGGWNPFEGFQVYNDDWSKLYYPGDPPMHLLYSSLLHNDEWIGVYESSWVVIRNTKTGEWKASRLD